MSPRVLVPRELALRDVDEAGTMRRGGSDDNPDGRGRLHDPQVVAVMDFIRYGTASAGEKE